MTTQFLEEEHSYFLNSATSSSKRTVKDCHILFRTHRVGGISELRDIFGDRVSLGEAIFFPIFLPRSLKIHCLKFSSLSFLISLSIYIFGKIVFSCDHFIMAQSFFKFLLENTFSSISAII